MVRRRATAATEGTQPPAKAATDLPPSGDGETATVSPAPAHPANGAAAQSLAALQVELAQATQREAWQQRQMRELEDQLTVAGDRIHTLEIELQDCKALTTKLAQSEETIRQLAQANAKLSQELEALEDKVSPPAPTTSRGLSARALPAKVEPPVLDAHDALMQHQRQRLAHPIFPDAKLPAQMADQDLGWFD